MAAQHPDYPQELERLSFTKAYMDQLIAAQETDQEALKRRQEDTLARLDFKDSSLRYQEMLSHANFMKMSADQLESLHRLRKKPYFARIDFHRKEKPEREVFYIGKMSLFDRETQLPIILDWRSPLANVYYEGRIGEVSYEAEGERYEGRVSLKRQYQIEEGELENFRDIDITTKDDLLQDSLSQNAENRLTEIVATIQEEQNEVIRADLRKPIIVQGAAGSGKTTIALHRISYFLYSMRDIFKPEEMLILAPNQLFIQYISEVLPELGVHKARQTTFIDFVRAVTDISWPVTTQHTNLMNTVEAGNAGHSTELWSAGYKGSDSFKEVMEQYSKYIESSYAVREDFRLAGFKLKSAKAINQLFYKHYHYFPYEVRVQKIKAVLRSELNRKKKQILSTLAKKYDDQLDRALFGMKDPEKRKKRVSFLITRKEEALDEIKKEAKTVLQTFMKNYPKWKLLDVYIHLYEERIFRSFIDQDTEELKQMRAWTRNYLRKQKLQSEDLAALLYLKSWITGIAKEDQVKKVVIDEAQDYSFFELYSLRHAFQTDLFTIVGDLAQGIYRYRGLKEWESLIGSVFQNVNYLKLQKTYRTTIEIMNLANELLELMPENLPKAEPVVRHGEKPQFINRNQGWLEIFKEKLSDLKASGMKSFAVVTKTQKEAALAAEQLDDIGAEFTMFDETQSQMTDRMVLPVYLAKGLEFDVVFLYSEGHSYQETTLDVKLLYVAMTRPLHRLFLIGENPEDFLLNHAHPSSFGYV
ncbi:DNA helicase [Halobacillus halophilus]|uniref:UvrD/REP helicase family protein n=1 Tax=Halobacillus halophilus (strain ATCC 35676 / DSM 2266 / JCM 20832 / KCTC 3685 / LMG 17431 / NBRC 102448 / NCIMB 2269) TaxID=866895 RepID=I0JK05_HALH3|nr:RNA polymerase recycling motor HelD [Halobacillus halophilus]ASF38624.1 DNA helicase [Halobacillus halophilus]CCG44474.1 UvrD/REP helicase family protein [Halobacillus halophilus DSM 2266]